MVLVRRQTIAVVLVVLLAGTALAPLGAASGDLAHGDERADLDIRQPSYVEESVDRETTDNRTIYNVEGPEHEIRLESVNHSDVEAAGVLDGSGSIEYVEEIDAWVFDAEGDAGTRVVYFDVATTVEETRQVEDGNETVTETYETEETVRHVATLSVENVEWAHRPEERDADMREAAANWSAVDSTANRLAPEKTTEETLEQAFEYYEFMVNPFASFLGDARGTIMMATRPGGLAVFGGILGLSAAILGYSLVRLHRKERQLEEIGDVDEARDEAYLEMAREILQQRDWDDFLPEHMARHCRNYLGRNVYLGYKRYLLLRSPTHTKGLLLQLMGQVGYVGRARVDEHGEIVEASVVRAEDEADLATDGGDAPTAVDLTKLDADVDADRRFVDLVSGDDLDVDVLHRPGELDLEAVEWPIDERDASDSELLEAINPEFPDDFEDEEQLADVLAGLMRLVGNHDFTTEDGRPRGDRDLLSFLSELDSVLCDEVDFPLAPTQRQILFLAAERMDKGEELQAQVDRLSEEGLELGGELDLDDGSDEDDDPDGGAFDFSDDSDGDDGDDGGEAAETDEDAPESDVDEEPEDDSGDTDDVDEDDEPEGESSRLPTPDDGTPLEALAIAAGYDVHTETGLEDLAEDAGLSWDMDPEEISSRVLVHCRGEISSEELIEIIKSGGDQS